MTTDLIQSTYRRTMEKAGKREIALLMLCTLTNACSTVGGAIAVQPGADADTAQYSQRHETEADSAAVVITVNAGIDREGLPAFLQKVLEQRTEQPTPLEAFFGSHPTDRKRIAALRQTSNRPVTGTQPAENDSCRRGA